MAKKDWMVKESELDDIQILVFQEILDKSLIVSGCAGSGKSVLALLKAERIQTENKGSYNVIVYTRSLCSYMNAGKKDVKLSGNFMYYEEWRYKRGPKHYANGKTYIVYLRDDSGNKIPNMPQADYVIVDEIQDFTREEILEFVASAKKQFIFLGDTNQSIFNSLKAYNGGTVAVEKIPQIVRREKIKTFELLYNHRLPKPVAKIVHEMDGIDVGPYIDKVYTSNENADPRIIKFDSFEEQLDCILRLLKRNNDIGILLPTNKSIKIVSDFLNRNGINHELKYEDEEDWKKNIDNLDFKTDNPKLLTYHSAKGLQFGTVILPDYYNMDFRNINALYVAMTRTYRNLYILYSGILPKPLLSVSSNLYKTTESDQVEDI